MSLVVNFVAETDKGLQTEVASPAWRYQDIMIDAGDFNPNRRTVVVTTRSSSILSVLQKMPRLRPWGLDATKTSKGELRYGFIHVDQESFEQHKPNSSSDLVSAFRNYQEHHK